MSFKKNNKNKGRRQNAHRPMGRGQQLIPHPPQIQTQLKHKCRLRFQSNAAFAANITFQNLLDTINVATSGSTARDLFFMVKIKAVEIWANNTTDAVKNVEFQFSGLTPGQLGDETMHQDVSVGIEPAHVRAVPKGAQLRSWQPSTTAVAFYLEVPINAIIDVEAEFYNGLIGAPPAVVVNPAATVTAGTLYLRGLDGQPIASTTLPPLGSNNVN